MDNSDEHTEIEPAGRSRRVAALIVDFILTISLAHLLFGIVGAVLPVDGDGVLLPLVMVSVLAGFFYLAMATPLVGNTLGKFTMGIQARPFEEGVTALPWYRWVFRLMLIGFWPINFIMILVHPQRRHLGDLAASTWVVVDRQRNFVVGLVACIALVVAAGWIGGRALRVAAWNTGAYTTAVSKMKAEGQEPDFLPVGMIMQGSAAFISLDSEAGRRSFRLERRGGEWTIEDENPGLEVTTVGFASGAASISGM